VVISVITGHFAASHGRAGGEERKNSCGSE